MRERHADRNTDSCVHYASRAWRTLPRRSNAALPRRWLRVVPRFLQAVVFRVRILRARTGARTELVHVAIHFQVIAVRVEKLDARVTAHGAPPIPDNRDAA